MTEWQSIKFDVGYELSQFPRKWTRLHVLRVYVECIWKHCKYWFLRTICIFRGHTGSYWFESGKDTCKIRGVCSRCGEHWTETLY